MKYYIPATLPFLIFSALHLHLQFQFHFHSNSNSISLQCINFSLICMAFSGAPYGTSLLSHLQNL